MRPLIVLGISLWALAGPAPSAQEIIAYGPEASPPGDASVLAVGRISVALPAGVAALVDAMGVVRITIRALPAQGPSFPRSEVAAIIVDSPDAMGTLRPTLIASYPRGQGIAFTPTGDILGFLYRYQGSDVLRYYVRAGLRFRTGADCAALRVAWLSVPAIAPGRCRLGGVDGWTLAPGCSLAPRAADRRGPVSAESGAWLLIPVLGGPVLARQERDVIMAWGDVDPLHCEGDIITTGPGFSGSQGVVFAFRRQADGVPVRATCDPGIPPSAAPPAAVLDRMASLELAAQGQDPLLPHRSPPPDGPYAAMVRAAGLAASSIPDHGTIKQAVEQTTAAAEVVPGTGLPDAGAIIAQMQASLVKTGGGLRSAAGASRGRPDSTDRDPWSVAVQQTEHILAQELGLPPGPIRGPRYHHAESLPAGFLPADQQGFPHGDGGNPDPAEPAGLALQGAPFYDLDGDGRLDRWNTTDPFRNQVRRIRVAWNFANDFRIGSVDPSLAAVWALWGISDDNAASLLCCGADQVFNRVAQRTVGWKLGVAFYGPALGNLMQDVPGHPGEYDFHLIWCGTVRQPGTLPTTLSTNTTRITLPAGSRGPGQGSARIETITRYPGILDQDQLAGQVWSSDGWRPVLAGDPPGMPVLDRVDFPDGSHIEAWYPAWFRPDLVDLEKGSAGSAVDGLWMWDEAGFDPGRPPGPDNCPGNYHRGDHFGRFSTFGFPLDAPAVVAAFCAGARPVLGVEPPLSAAGRPEIRFRLREIPAPAPSGQALSGWIAGRAMDHRGTSGFDPRTDMAPGRVYNCATGDRILSVVDGVGWFIFRGRQLIFANPDQERTLVRSMWDESFRTPEPVVMVARANQDDTASQPLGSLGRSSMASPALRHPGGRTAPQALLDDGRLARTSLRAALERRSRLRSGPILLFSASRGRSWEVDMARRAPPDWRLVCIEYDDIAQVLADLDPRPVIFITSLDEEDDLRIAIADDWWGRRHRIAVPMAAGGVGIDHDGTQDPSSWNAAHPGRHCFAPGDLDGGRPVVRIGICAHLDHGQVHAPRTDQWTSQGMVEFRHPMLMIYDDHASTVSAYYGHDIDAVLSDPITGNALGPSGDGPAATGDGGTTP